MKMYLQSRASIIGNFADTVAILPPSIQCIQYLFKYGDISIKPTS